MLGDEVPSQIPLEWVKLMASALDPSAVPQLFQDPLHRPLAKAHPVADLAAGVTSRLQLQNHPPVFIDDLVPRGPGQKRNQVLLLIQVVRFRLDPVKETPPDTLQEVGRVEP